MKHAIKYISENESADAQYQKFLDCCADIYVTIRPHYTLFLSLLSLLNTAQPKVAFRFSQQDVQEQLLQRFLPGLSDGEAKVVFIDLIKKSEDNVMQLLNDRCRDLRRQKTLESVTTAINYVFDWVWPMYTGSIPESSNRSTIKKS